MRNKECNCEESRSQQPLRSGMWNTGTLTYDIRITMTPPIAECRSSCRVSPRVTTVATTSFNNEIEEFFSGPASLPRPDLSGLNKIKKTEAKKETNREKDKDGRCNFVRTLSSQTMKASVPVLFFFIPSCWLNDAASVFWNRLSRFCVEATENFVALLWFRLKFGASYFTATKIWTFNI